MLEVPGADSISVDAVVLLVMVVASGALAVAGARAMLMAVLHVMAHPPVPPRIRWPEILGAFTR